MTPLERYLLLGREEGCPRDQMDNLVMAGVYLQERQLAASAAARLCDAPGGPTAVGYGGARGGGKSHWLLAQMGADDCMRVSPVRSLQRGLRNRLAIWDATSLRILTLLTQPLERLLCKETCWETTVIEGTEVVEADEHEADWPAATQLVLVRHRVRDKQGGPGASSCSNVRATCIRRWRPTCRAALRRWRCGGTIADRRRARGVIKELDAGDGLGHLASQSSCATGAALSLGVLAHNLVVLFQRKLGWLER